MTTFMAKTGQVQRKWYVLDAEGKTLGALAVEAAVLLRGKHKPIYTPHVVRSSSKKNGSPTPAIPAV